LLAAFAINPRFDFDTSLPGDFADKG